MRALIVVDMQNDFVTVTGSLAVPDAESIVPVVNDLIASSDYGLVVLTRDWHPAGHCSFDFMGGPWPVHCVKYSVGARIIVPRPSGSLLVTKGDRRAVEAYSGFDGFVENEKDGTLVSALDGRGVEAVDVVGLALDVCVKATAFDSAKWGYDTRVLLDATRAVTRPGQDTAVQELREAGVEVR